jgi:DNA-binding response OmpR family regulator
LPRILIVEDEPPLREALAAYLRREGWNVDEATDGEEGWRLFRTQPPDLVVLDRKLPGLSGEELCRRIKGLSEVPVLVTTSLVQEDAVLEGFALGADDYVRKPYSAREVTARIQVLLKSSRSRPRVEDPTTGLVLDPGSRTAALGGRPLGLTPHEYDLALLFVGSPDRVFSRQELLERVWSHQVEVSDRTVDAHVKNLRAKLGGTQKALVTVWGKGYRWSP